MRSTIIPAQITTVEDRIAGSFTMAQILILLTPVIWTTFLYICVVPSMKFSMVKGVCSVIAMLIACILALRVKQKIVAVWLGVLVSYWMRPKYYVFNKNDRTHRVVDMFQLPQSTHRVIRQQNTHTRTQSSDLELADQIKLEQIMRSGAVAVHYEWGK